MELGSRSGLDSPLLQVSTAGFPALPPPPCIPSTTPLIYIPIPSTSPYPLPPRLLYPHSLYLLIPSTSPLFCIPIPSTSPFPLPLRSSVSPFPLPPRSSISPFHLPPHTLYLPALLYPHSIYLPALLYPHSIYLPVPSVSPPPLVVPGAVFVTVFCTTVQRASYGVHELLRGSGEVLTTLKFSLVNAHAMILIVHIFMNVNKLCLDQQIVLVVADGLSCLCGLELPVQCCFTSTETLRIIDCTCSSSMLLYRVHRDPKDYWLHMFKFNVALPRPQRP